jgi:hypothetical protein
MESSDSSKNPYSKHYTESKSSLGWVGGSAKVMPERAKKVKKNINDKLKRALTKQKPEKPRNYDPYYLFNLNNTNRKRKLHAKENPTLATENTKNEFLADEILGNGRDSADSSFEAERIGNFEERLMS